MLGFEPCRGPFLLETTMTAYEDKTDDVTDERIAKRLGVDIDRVKRVCECLACGYYGKD